MAYLVSELIETLRTEGMLPPSDESASSARLLATLNREQRVYLSRLLLSVREAHQVAHADVATESGITRYPIPSRAIGAKLKVVTQLENGRALPLHPMPYERQVEDASAGGPGDYWLESNSIVLRSAPAVAGTLRLTYFRRLNKLVTEEEVAVITEIFPDDNTVVVEASPSDWSTAAANYDFVKSTPHFDTIGADQSATRTNEDFVFASALPDDLEVGDYVTLAGETPVCQAPLELHDVLALRAAYVTLAQLGDPKASVTLERLNQARDDALALLAPRVDGDPEVLINPNAPGWGRFWRRRR